MRRVGEPEVVTVDLAIVAHALNMGLRFLLFLTQG